MNTKDIGTLGEVKAIAHYIENGYEVSLPIGDRRPYDFIAEKSGECFRVQVKCTTVNEVDLRVTGGNKSRNTSKKYRAGDFDELLIVKIGGEKDLFFFFEAADIVGRRSITVR